MLTIARGPTTTTSTTRSYCSSASLLETTLITLHENALKGSDWQTQRDCFVPLRASWQANSPSDFALETEINTFMENDEKKVLLLLGDSGSGKSLYTQGLVAQTWEHYQTGGLIPLWISLPSLKDPIHDVMTETLLKVGFNEEQIQGLQENRKFLLILDGYDEIREWQNLYVTNRLEDWQVKVIITCRREYLYLADDYTKFFKPFDKGRPQHLWYEEMVVKPFSSEQIDTYLQYVIAKGETQWQDWEQYRKAIDEIPGLASLLATPFMLKMAVDVLPSLAERYREEGDENRKQMTQASLYDACLQNWFERQEVKLKQAKKIEQGKDIKASFWNYAKALAQAMHEANITVVHYEGEDNFFGEEAESTPWSRFFAPENEYLELLQTSCLIREVGPHQYAFVHSSLLDYFLTRGLYDAVELSPLSPNAFMGERVRVTGEKEKSENASKAHKGKEKEQERNKSAGGKQNYFNQRLLTKEGNNIQFLADRVTGGDEAYQAWLFAQIEASKNNPEMKIAAANAITILNRARVSLSGKNFRGVQIPQADLSYVLMSGTDLTGADLTGVSFHQAYIAHSNMSNACLRDANFGQRPSLLHKSNIIALGYFSNKRNLVTGDSKGVPTLWDAATGQSEKKLIISDAKINFTGNMNLYPDQGLIVVNYQDRVTLWHPMSDHKQLFTGEHLSRITTVALSPDGQWLAGGNANRGKNLWLFNVSSGLSHAVFEGHLTGVSAVAFSPDSQQLASSGGDYKNAYVRLWKVATGKLQEEIEGDAEILAYSADGRWLAMGGRCLCMWNFPNRKKLSKKDIKFIKALVFSPDGRQLALVSKDEDRTVVSMLEVVGGRKQIVLGGFASEICSIAFSADSRLLALGSKDNTVRLWEIATGQTQAIFQGHTDEVNFVAFSPNDDWLASGSLDGTVRQWEISSSGQRQVMLEEPLGNEMDVAIFSPNGRFLASIDNKIICLRDTTSGVLQGGFKGATNSVEVIALSSDGRSLASSENQTVYLWDIASGKVQWALTEHKEDVTSLAFSVDGRLLASGSLDKTVRLWYTATGQVYKVLNKFGYCDILVFSADSRWLVGGDDDRKIRLLEVMSRQSKAQLLLKHKDLCDVALSPDGHWLASGSDNKTVRLWELPSGQLYAEFRWGTSLVNFSPDSRLLLSGSDKEGIICLHNVVTRQSVVYRNGDRGIRAFHWDSQCNQLQVVNAINQLFVWFIPQNQGEHPVLLKDPSSWPLTTRGLILARAELSPQNRILLQQLDATETAQYDNMPLLTSTIAKIDTLVNINLANQKIGDGNFLILVFALVRNTSVTQLILNDNELSGRSLDCLIELLTKNHSIRYLNLANNHIGVSELSSVKVFAKALTSNQTLTELDLTDNGFKEDGLYALVEIVTDHRRSIRLQLIDKNNSCDFNIKIIIKLLSYPVVYLTKLKSKAKSGQIERLERTTAGSSRQVGNSAACTLGALGKTVAAADVVTTWPST